MTLTVDDIITHYVLSSHPRNKAIVDVKNKKTGQLCFIKIRHRLPKFYAASLVDPVTFEACIEIQASSATSRVKPITVHLDDMKDTTIDFRETARIGFEWTFEWENQKYKWIKENKMKSALECRAIRKTGNICVAQYLPCTLKDEYFGIFTVLGYNMLRCNLSQPHQLELILIMSLMTLLDKSNDGEWKKDNVSKEEVITAPPLESTKATNEKKVQQKKQLNDQKLEMMLEKDARRSRKQMQMSEKRLPMSAGNSPSQSPKMSPLPTPTTSASQMMMLSDFRLQHSQSSNLDFYGQPNKMPSNTHYIKPTTFIRPYEFGVNHKYFRTSSQKY